MIICHLVKVSKRLFNAVPNGIRWALFARPGGSISWIVHSSGRQVGCGSWVRVQLQELAGSLGLTPCEYLHKVTCASLQDGGWILKECAKRQELKLTCQLRATSRTGVALFYQKHIHPLHGGVAWSYFRSPRVMGEIILTVFWKYSLPTTALLMKLHSHIT